MSLLLPVYTGLASLNLVGVTLHMDLPERLAKPLLALHLRRSTHRRHACMPAGPALAAAGSTPAEAPPRPPDGLLAG
jgi:hypothetical protein